MGSVSRVLKVLAFAAAALALTGCGEKPSVNKAAADNAAEQVHDKAVVETADKIFSHKAVTEIRCDEVSGKSARLTLPSGQILKPQEARKILKIANADRSDIESLFTVGGGCWIAITFRTNGAEHGLYDSEPALVFLSREESIEAAFRKDPLLRPIAEQLGREQTATHEETHAHEAIDFWRVIFNNRYPDVSFPYTLNKTGQKLAAIFPSKLLTSDEARRISGRQADFSYLVEKEIELYDAQHDLDADKDFIRLENKDSVLADLAYRSRQAIPVLQKNIAAIEREERLQALRKDKGLYEIAAKVVERRNFLADIMDESNLNSWEEAIPDMVALATICAKHGAEIGDATVRNFIALRFVERNTDTTGLDDHTDDAILTDIFGANDNRLVRRAAALGSKASREDVYRLVVDEFDAYIRAKHPGWTVIPDPGKPSFLGRVPAHRTAKP